MNKTITFLTTISIYFSLYSFPALGQDFLMEKVETKVDKIAYKALKQQGFTSLSIGIFKEGKIYKKHFGELQKGGNNPPTDKTLYEIASVTKTFTGCLLAKAIMEQKLRLTADIRNYLPKGFENLEYEGNPIQVQHLVTHTSGLPFVLPQEIEELYNNPDSQLPFHISRIERSYSKPEFLQDLQTILLPGKPGTSYGYSDVGAEILGYILEGVYEKPYEELLEEFIFQRASMEHSALTLKGPDTTHLAPGYDGDGTLMPYSESRLWAAGAGIKSTIVDLIHFIEFQLDADISYVSASHELLYQDEENRIAYFWNMGESQSAGTYLYHHGGAFGAQNWLLIYPDLDMGISVITNQSAPETSGKLAQLANEIFQVIK